MLYFPPINQAPLFNNFRKTCISVLGPKTRNPSNWERREIISSTNFRLPIVVMWKVSILFSDRDIYIDINYYRVYGNKICEKLREIQTNFIESKNIRKLIYEINTYLFEGKEIPKEVFTNSKDYVFI